MINTTCAVDLAELEGDEATGADVCQGYKVVAPLTKSRRMGRGSVLHGGPAWRLIEYGCCKGVQGPLSGVEFAPVCTPVRCPRCRNENFACER